MAGFGKSFDDAFKPAYQSGSAAALEAVKEKIKSDTERKQTDSVAQGFQSTIISRAEREKRDLTQDEKDTVNAIEKLKGAGLSPSELSSTIKSIAANQFVDPSVIAQREASTAMNSSAAAMQQFLNKQMGIPSGGAPGIPGAQVPQALGGNTAPQAQAAAPALTPIITGVSKGKAEVSFPEGMLAKSKAELANSMTILQDIQSGKVQVPPDTKITIGDIAITANRTLNEQEQKAVVNNVMIKDSVDYIVNAAKTGKVSGLWEQVLLDSSSPLVVSGEAEKIQSELNNLKSTIPFLKGGKQLTPFEAKRLFVLLDTKGKEVSTVIRDIQRFKKEAGLITQITIGGSQEALKLLKESQSEDTPTFGSVEEARKAGLADGTPIIVGGQTGIWTND